MGISFFVMLVIAALTSSISLVEPAVAWLVENKNFSRQKACLWTGLSTWLLGIGSIFSFNVWDNVKLFDRSIFQLLDYLTANLMLPIGGFSIAIFAGWIMSRQSSEQELNMPTVQSYQIWKILISYVAPSAVFFVFLHVVGVL